MADGKDKESFCCWNAHKMRRELTFYPMNISTSHKNYTLQWNVRIECALALCCSIYFWCMLLCLLLLLFHLSLAATQWGHNFQCYRQHCTHRYLDIVFVFNAFLIGVVFTFFHFVSFFHFLKRAVQKKRRIRRQNYSRQQHQHHRRQVFYMQKCLDDITNGSVYFARRLFMCI